MKLWIDFGPAIGIKKTSAQITVHYTPETLLGRQVAAVVNFPPRQIGPFISEVLTLGFPDANGAVVLIGPSLPVPNGQAHELQLRRLAASFASALLRRAYRFRARTRAHLS